ncbi:MAG: hypothetical protein LCH96_14995 [Actinobacteria bacterium]|nr:hypothetical protein [Actinomycetota bacterium]
MTEPEEFEREEKAFRDAFADEAAGQSFRPLDPATVTPASGSEGTRRWGRALAAAAAVVAVVLGIGVVLPRVFQSSGVAASSATVAGVPEAAGGSEAAGGKAADAQAPEPTPTAYDGSLPAPAAGNRWESYRDVMVQVPDSWAYAYAPRSDHCAVKDLPTTPYVDLARGERFTMAIQCPDLRDDEQAMHLTFWPLGTDSSSRTAASSGWQEYRRDVGQVTIVVTAKSGQAALANRILDSAGVVPSGRDPNGCPTSLPDVPASDLASLDGTELTVCLYEADTDRGAFRSSVALTGSKAADAWRDVLAAPQGGGPDADPATCGTGQAWPVVLYVGPDRVPVAAFLAGCTGNGVVDAAASGGLRTLTRGVCHALLVDPVRLSGGFGPAAELCS